MFLLVLAIPKRADLSVEPLLEGDDWGVPHDPFLAPPVAPSASKERSRSDRARVPRGLRLRGWLFGMSHESQLRLKCPGGHQFCGLSVYRWIQ
eukprot:1275026-Lingulodinium_polyedra.AAC.1